MSDFYRSIDYYKLILEDVLVKNVYMRCEIKKGMKCEVRKKELMAALKSIDNNIKKNLKIIKST